MKNLFRFSMLAMSMVFVAFSLASCGPEGNPDDPNGNGNNGNGGSTVDPAKADFVLDRAEAILYGDIKWYDVNQDRNDVELIEFMLYGGDTERFVDGATSGFRGTGQILKLAVIAAKGEGELAIRTGKFTVAPYDQKAPKANSVVALPMPDDAADFQMAWTHPGAPSSVSFEWKGETGGDIADAICPTTGDVNISEKDGEYTISATLNGKTFYYKGKPSLFQSIETIESLYGDEEDYREDGLTLEFDEVYAEGKGNALGTFDDIIVQFVQYDRNDNIYAQANVYLKAPTGIGSGYKFDGKEFFFDYNRSTGTIGTYLKGDAGHMSDGGPAGSAIKLGGVKTYYIASGTLTVGLDKKITINAYSGRGTKITLKSKEEYIEGAY